MTSPTASTRARDKYEVIAPVDPALRRPTPSSCWPSPAAIRPMSWPSGIRSSQAGWIPGLLQPLDEMMPPEQWRQLRNDMYPIARKIGHVQGPPVRRDGRLGPVGLLLPPG